ncbi:MAG: PEP/pyruvate-binding domain-containing protein [Pirellulaceae bacterium]
MKSVYTKSLHELNASRVAEAGGKGASLGELMRAGAPVPPGFVVVSEAFEQFLGDNSRRLEVDRIFAELDRAELGAKDAAARICQLLKDAKMPAEVKNAVDDAVRRLGEKLVSVRSSATCEDSGASAWAGQLETYLNVTPEQVVAKVRDCWLSAFRESALAYGSTHGHGGRRFAVAVVVQQMVASEVSGVGFSVHPVTQEPNVLFIEACLGLGEAIVSGRIMPDQYIVERDAGARFDAIVGAQREGLFVDAQGRSAWRQLGEDGKTRKLSDAQVVEYAGMLSRIHDHYGHPVDTEWALEDGAFQVLQARPITTLAEEYQQPLVPEPDFWQHIVRRPMTLLDASIWAHWLDSAHIDDKIGVAVDQAMSIQDEGGMANHFVPRAAQDAGIDRVAELYGHDRPQLIEILEDCHALYRASLQRIEQHAEEFQDIDAAADFLSNVAQHTTVFPSWVLLAYEKFGLDDPELRALAEGLRSHSLYPTIEHRLIAPLAARATEALGFSAPAEANKVVTWQELHDKSIDRQQLESRLAQVRAGRHFLFRSIDGRDSVRFVSQTGYLLMRLARQRKVVPTTHPDVLSGHAAWPGVHRARARVVMSADGSDETINEGEVLVSIQSNPALMPLLLRCGAVVTDDGGIVCHAAIIARELRKPTLIGTGRATSVIRTGDLVEVDTFAQEVRVLERVP